MVGANAGGKIVVDTIAGTDRGQTKSVISSNLHCISLLEKSKSSLILTGARPTHLSTDLSYRTGKSQRLLCLLVGLPSEIERAQNVNFR